MKCKFIEKSLVFCLFFVVSKPLQAQEWIMNLRNPNMPFQLQYSGQTLSSSRAEKYSDEMEVERTSGRMTIPISKEASLKQSVSFDYTHTQFKQVNETPQSPIPEKLTEMRSGYQLISQIDDLRHWGLNTQFGSSSDEPFHNWNVIDVSVTSFYAVDTSPESTWVYLLNYSNQRSFLPHIPLPGFIYIYNNKKGLVLLAGIPVFGMNYLITPKLMMSYFSILPWTHNLKFSYFLRGKDLQLYTEYKISADTYKLLDYVDNEDRVILSDYKAILGIKLPLTYTLIMDLHGGYSMKRKIYQAKRPGATPDWEENLASQAFFNAQLGVSF